MSRRGGWIQTFTGMAVYPLDPRPEEIDIVDIAHSLSMQCRFAGHCHTFYSVAEHSVRVSRLVPVGCAAWGLLHDAAEAYLVDVPRPLKNDRAMQFYRLAEERLLVAIAARFNLKGPMPAEVKRADAIMLATEARDLMAAPPMPWAEMPPPFSDRIGPWRQKDAKAGFLRKYDVLSLDGFLPQRAGRRNEKAQGV